MKSRQQCFNTLWLSLSLLVTVIVDFTGGSFSAPGDVNDLLNLASLDQGWSLSFAGTTVLADRVIPEPSSLVLFLAALPLMRRLRRRDGRQIGGLLSLANGCRRSMNPNFKSFIICVAAIALIATVQNIGFAQAPAHSDVAYDSDHPSQCVDVYLAKSDKPSPAMIYIHGGGWRAGSKKSVPAWLKAFVAEGKLSVVAVEYRFTDVATHPAQVSDCLRAIQFVRQNAEQWNIDPKRLGVTGGSAGGHLSAYVALHDDVAMSESDDPVERQSSRVACAVSFAGPTDWSLLSSINHTHPAYRQLIGYQPGTPAAELDAGLIKDVSPISFVSKDDPPIMQVHGDEDSIVPLKHASNLHEKLQHTGVRSELVVIPGGNHGVSGAGGQVAKRPTKFVQRYLLSH